MKSVALVALVAAPVALAFSPHDLTGVWHCVSDDGYNLSPQHANANTVISAATSVANVFTTVDSNNDNERVVVFNKPSDQAATRRLEGRTYYNGRGATVIEEHDFHGVMDSGVSGDFYLDPNWLNLECGGFLTPATPIQVTVAANDNYHPSLLSTQFGVSSGGCFYKPQGPWEFTLDDVDHMTLTVDPSDTQQKNNLFADGGVGGASTQVSAAGNAIAAIAVGAVSFFAPSTTIGSMEHFPRVFVVEKCMRGLKESSIMCGKLARSDLTSPEQKDSACQGTLVCAQQSTTSPWGCNSDECCSVRPQQQFIPQYSPQPYYQPSYYPSYYPQQGNQWNQGNQFGNQGFWG